MKCSKCGNKTTWNTSYGERKHLVCLECFEKMLKENNNNVMETFNEIFKNPIDK